MGIQNLLSVLAPVTTDIHISKLKGKTVALDGHGFLHRGAYALTYTDYKKGEEVESQTKFIMFYINLLKHYEVTPIVVFDGLPLPLKADTDRDRSMKRTEALFKAEQLYLQGKFTEANKSYRQASSITTAMLSGVIMNLQREKIQCIVAPYEADAQLTFLMKTNKVDAVITQDSDHLAFGCSNVIFKIDREGNGKQIKFDDIFRNHLQLDHLNPTTFRQACILSGCDYLPSVRGIGIKSAISFFKDGKDTDEVIDLIQYKQPRGFPKDYRNKFYQAELGFLYQWVYDPDAKDYVRLNPVPDNISDTDLLILGHKPVPSDLSLLRVNKVIRSSATLTLSSASITATCEQSTTVSSLSISENATIGYSTSASPGHVASPKKSTKRKATDTEEVDHTKRLKQSSVPELAVLSATTSRALSSNAKRSMSWEQYLLSVKENINPHGTHLASNDAGKSTKKEEAHASIYQRPNSLLLDEIRNYDTLVSNTATTRQPNTPKQRRFPRVLSPVGHLPSNYTRTCY
ncbi:PIN domain-like protein [Mycotypha africana]|uniref:PIN domain-like protein n=1 Tax=Mycotypha africana TaxID=64632 RepID=UPI002300C33A|nr:PIN domain-like protein [Mycotypha africana]KAI8981631.1 PIN domain-like protein [Mycotypha africana]